VQRGEGRRNGPRGHDHRERVRGLHVSQDRLQVGSIRRWERLVIRVRQDLVGDDDVIRGEHRAVGPPGILAQVEGVGAAIGRDFGRRLRQEWPQGTVDLDHEQTVEQHARDPERIRHERTDIQAFDLAAPRRVCRP